MLTGFIKRLMITSTKQSLHGSFHLSNLTQDNFSNKIKSKQIFFPLYIHNVYTESLTVCKMAPWVFETVQPTTEISDFFFLVQFHEALISSLPWPIIKNTNICTEANDICHSFITKSSQQWLQNWKLKWNIFITVRFRNAFLRLSTVLGLLNIHFFGQPKHRLHIIELCRPELCAFRTPNFTVLTKDTTEIARINKNIKVLGLPASSLSLQNDLRLLVQTHRIQLLGSQLIRYALFSDQEVKAIPTFKD